MARFHCDEHNLDYNSVCPSCRDEEAADARNNIISSLAEQAEEAKLQAREMKSQLETLSYRQVNPGEYTCPECLYITLKKKARRCPTCRAGINQSYWDRIESEERVEALRKEEAERVIAEEKAEAERQAKEAQQREAHLAKKEARRLKEEQEYANQKLRETLTLVFLVIVVVVVGGVCLAGLSLLLNSLAEMVKGW